MSGTGRKSGRVTIAQFCATLTLFLPASCLAQLPATQLDGVFPLGAPSGSSFELTIAGQDLDDVDRLTFTHPGITAKQKMAEPSPFDEGPQAVPNVFQVTIAAHVPSGKQEIRCQGKYGLSNAPVVIVGETAETLEVERTQSFRLGNDVSDDERRPRSLHRSGLRRSQGGSRKIQHNDQI